MSAVALDLTEASVLIEEECGYHVLVICAAGFLIGANAQTSISQPIAPRYSVDRVG